MVSAFFLRNLLSKESQPFPEGLFRKTTSPKEINGYSATFTHLYILAHVARAQYVLILFVLSLVRPEELSHNTFSHFFLLSRLGDR